MMDISSIEEKHKIIFRDYFSSELEALQVMQADELVDVNDRTIRVLPKGRLIIRNICMVFDRYLQGRQGEKSFSRVI